MRIQTSAIILPLGLNIICYLYILIQKSSYNIIQITKLLHKKIIHRINKFHFELQMTSSLNEKFQKYMEIVEDMSNVVQRAYQVYLQLKDQEFAHLLDPEYLADYYPCCFIPDHYLM